MVILSVRGSVWVIFKAAIQSNTREGQDLSEVTCCTVSDCVGEFCSIGGILKGGEGNKIVVPNKDQTFCFKCQFYNNIGKYTYFL